MAKLLVVVDMQKDFVTGCLGTKEACDIVEKVRDYVKNFDGEVVFTRDTHDGDYMESLEGSKLPVVHCIKGSDGWDLVPELKDLARGRKVFDKPAFGSVEFANWLSELNFDEIEFCGVCTGICVISNAILAKAFKPNTPVKVHKDLCACVTPQSHETALEAMKTAHIDII